MATRHRRNEMKNHMSNWYALLGTALAFSAMSCGNMGDASVGGGSSATSGSSSGSGAGGSSSTAQFACQGVGNGIGEMVQVPAGEFLMGCNTAVDAECRGDEQPSHTVFVSEFQIDKVEVTQGMYAACVQAQECDPPSCEWDCSLTNNPAGCVTRDQANSYCTWAGKRLPTEAEWEKAARGTDGRKFPWGNDPPTCDLANISGCGQVAQAVGSHPAGASPYGALDMAGNMVEMLADWYDAGYYQVMPTSDPKGPASGTTYVGRGGGWKSDPVWQRTSVRDWYEPVNAGRSLGFRCAR